jgi:VanZ family protein
MASIFLVSSFRVELPAALHAVHGDKAVHALEYAILGYLSAQAALRTWPDRAPLRAAMVGLLIALGFGLSDELHQAFVPGRSADAWDLLADGVGATLGAVLRLGRTVSRRP